jgi:hypothetical protein
LETAAAKPEAEGGYDEFGVEDEDEAEGDDAIEAVELDSEADDESTESEEDVEAGELRLSPFDIGEDVIYDPPHVPPRIRAQDGVLLACHQPLQPLAERDYLELVIKASAHDDIRRRLDQYGVFDKQLFPDLTVSPNG